MEVRAAATLSMETVVFYFHPLTRALEQVIKIGFSTPGSHFA
jgi:hypothetical protein